MNIRGVEDITETYKYKTETNQLYKLEPLCHSQQATQMKGTYGYNKSILFTTKSKIA